MPIIHMHLLEGQTVEKKRAVADAMTKAVCDTLNKKPEQVRIIFSDMARHDYAVGGVLHEDAE